MDLWIGVEDRGDRREVSLQGRLAGPAVAELDRVAQELEPPIFINLSQLLSIDDEGLRALQARRQAGVELVGTRPLIQHLLESSAGRPRE